LLAVMLIYHPPLGVMIPATMLFIVVIAAQENTATIAALRLAGDARGAAMSWNELAAGLGSLLGIGSCSIGLAIGGVQGLGIALTSIAVVATASSVFALWYADYRDDPEELQPVSV
jgi:predicted MFS family arabinose efflux permease